MRLVRSLTLLAAAMAVALALSACRTTKEDKTYSYDAAAHERAVELKSKALAVMANSVEAYSAHRADVEAVNADMEHAYELSAAAPDNEAVASEWALIKDPGGDLYGGYIRRWQAAGRIDQATRDAAMARVTVDFDYLLCLEAAKRTKAGICTPPAAASPAPGEPGAAPAAPPPA